MMDVYINDINLCATLASEYHKTKDAKLIDELGKMVFEMQNHNHALSQADKEHIYDIYRGRLYFVAKTLRMMGFRPQLIIDTVLEPIFMYTTFTTRLLDFIAIMTREFLKGITYFQRNSANEQTDRPIYHRALSCGRRNALHELDCTGFYDSPQEFLMRSMKTRKCAIERLVYDKLFEKYFPAQEQDFGHRMMLRMSGREDFFSKCFPSTTIEVKVNFNKDAVPFELEISQCNPNKIIVERYKKETNMYNPDMLNWNEISKLSIQEVNAVFTDSVACYRLVYDRESFIKIHSKKIQNFGNPIDEWVVEDLAKLNTFSDG